MEEKRFIIENNKDEFLLYKSILQSQRSDGTHMHLTIAPTMDCNFSCHYCFEKKEKSYINSDRIDSLIKYLENKDDIK
ncbi:sulfatase maturation enzyme AslB (radical SAM superfamily), partial [Dysgonomonas sp. PFB1-18]|nr:sulfatase maturation enzyme AslB (radical SAM superfamily) [Dysgonomonas sp. PFB1-18]